MNGDGSMRAKKNFKSLLKENFQFVLGIFVDGIETESISSTNVTDSPV